jgi:hypothetical protein
MKIGDPMECCVCHNVSDKYCYHQRLGVAICSDCPLTDVMGEDVTMHTMYWVRPLTGIL